MQRRELLAGAAAALAMTAGCIDNSDNTPTESPTDEPTDSPTDSPTSTDSSTDTTTSTPEDDTPSETPTDSTESPTGTTTDDGVEEITVGPNGNLVFEPDDLVVTEGTTVRWIWDSDFHNIVVSSSPSGSDWSGVDQTQDAGYTHEHTFTATGEYSYYCEPHQSLGMKATLTVIQE